MVNHYISSNGTATWTESTNIDTPCSLHTANINAIAGDTIYLRGGSYTIKSQYDLTDTRGIIPSNSGSNGLPITYTVYGSEVVNLVGQADIGIGSIGIWINAKSYIKVDGKSLGQLNLSKMRVNMYIGPLSGAPSIGISSYNEISYIWAHDSYQNESWSWAWQGNAIWKRAYYNHIHHCKFEKHGYIAAGTSLDNEGNLFDLGTENANEDSEITCYNVIENNEFFHGGHATFGFFGDHNIVRNNYFHNEGWYTVKDIDDYEDMKYGYRNIIGNGVPGYVGYNLFEGNRIGHAAPNPSILWIVYGETSGWCLKGVVCPVDGQKYWHWGGTGMKVCTPHNIIRYNSFFNNSSTSLALATYSEPYTAKGQYNRIYNNTFFKNGWYQELPTLYWMYTKPIGFGYTGTGDWSVIYDNVIKNNLFYDNANIQTSVDVWDVSGGATYADVVNPTKGNCTIMNNYNSSAGQNINPIFINENINETTSWTLPNLALQSSSPSIDGGINLTQASGYGSSSTTLVVDDAQYFQDGNFGLGTTLSWQSSVNIQADWIAIGTVNNIVQINSVNYSTNTITLASPMTWNDNAPIWLYKKSDGEIVLYGSAPDIGAYEYTTGECPPVSASFNLQVI